MPRYAMMAFFFAASAFAARAADDPVRWKVEHPILCLAFSPDGKTLVIGGPERKTDDKDARLSDQPGKLTVINAVTGKVRRSITTDRGILAVAFSPDGKHLLTGGAWSVFASADAKRTVFPRVWDAETLKLELQAEGHTAVITGAAFFPDGKRMITAGGDETLRVWDAATGKELLVIKTGSNFNVSMTLSPDGKRVTVGSGSTKATVWDTKSGKPVFTLEPGYSAIKVAFSRDNSLIAVSSGGVNDITLWDGKSGVKKGSIIVGWDREKKVLVAKNVTSNLIFSPDGKWLVTGNGDLSGDSQDGALTIWDVAAKKKHAALQGHAGPIRLLAFTPDGKKLVSTSADGTLMLWNFAKLINGKSE